MKLKIILLGSSLSFFAIHTMQKQDALVSAREEVLRKTFKVQQVQKLLKTAPELTAKLAAMKKAQLPYSGPQVFDIICSNCCIDAKSFALVHRDGNTTDIYQSQNPFNKILTLSQEGLPFGINACASQ